MKNTSKIGLVVLVGLIGFVATSFGVVVREYESSPKTVKTENGVKVETSRTIKYKMFSNLIELKEVTLDGGKPLIAVGTYKMGDPVVVEVDPLLLDVIREELVKFCDGIEQFDPENVYEFLRKKGVTYVVTQVEPSKLEV